ncbi:MAG: alpha/beta fold hydrolase [Amaricoccus sp.]
MEGFDHAEGQHITVGDARIWCAHRGPPDAPVLVLLHGGFGSVADYDRLVPALVPHLRLVAIDSRGHGASTMGSARLSYARIAEDVEAVCAALGIARCHLLGYSDGGIVGLRLAAAGWPRLSRLATVGATWRLLPDDPVRDFVARLTPEGSRASDPRGHATYERFNPEPDFAAFVDAVRGLWLDGSETGYPVESVRGIGVPVLFVRGDSDPFLPLAEQAELSQRVAGSRLLNLPFAGHDAQASEPEAVAAALLRFLAPA